MSENELKSNESIKFELLIRNTDEPFVLVGRDLNIITFNEEFKYQYFKYFSVQVKKGESILSYARSGVEAARELYKKAFQGIKSETELAIPVTKNVFHTVLIKHKPALNETGQIFGVFVTMMDITQQKLALDSHNRFQSLIENAKVIISLIDKDGNMIYTSPSVCAITGYSFDELKEGKHFSKMHPEYQKDSKKVLEEALQNPGKPIHRINCFTHKNGSEIWLEGTITNLLYDDNVKAIVSNFRDITEKKAAEEKLSASENNLKAIFNNSTEAFLLLDKDFTIKTFNDNAKQNYSFTDKEMQTGVNLLDYIQHERQEYFQNYLNRVLNGETLDYDTHYEIKEDNTSKWFNATLSPVFENDSVTGICITRRDITKRKNIEEELKANEKSLQLSEQLFKALVQDGADLISVLDINGIYKFISPSAKSVIGMDAEFLIGKNAFDNIHEEDQQRVINQFNLLHRKKRVHITPFRFKTAAGTWIWLETIATNMLDEPAVNGIISNSRDITLNVHYNQKLKLNFERYESLAKATSDAIWDHDFEIDRTYLAGEGYKNLFGYNIVNQFSEFQFWESKLHPEEKETIINNLNQLVKNPDTIQSELEYRFLKADGNYAYVRDRFFIIRENGKAIRMLGAKQDITNQRTAEKEKEKLIAELIQNNKDLKQFSYITSHNLRGPIANLLGLNALIDTHEIKDESLKQILSGIKKATFMFDDIIKDLTKVLNIKDHISMPQEELNILSSLDKGIAQNENLLLEVDAKINSDFSKAPVLKFNKAYFESILFNLISNSIKYRSPARKLTVNITSEIINSEVVLKFTDNGLGLDLELYKDRLFSLYQRFHDHAEGRGLGLFLVKSQMEALNGSIDVESTVGKGTTFILKFAMN